MFKHLPNDVDFVNSSPFWRTGLLHHCIHIMGDHHSIHVGINPFRPEFTIVIHYKPRIAVAILDL